MMCKGEYGYDVIAEYEKIAEELKMHKLSEVLMEVVKQRLREEYTKISKLQQEVARLLGYKEDVTIDKMISDWELSKELFPGLSWNSQMSRNLKRLKDIHKSQEELFEEKVDEEESKFLNMTEDEIEAHNASVRMRAGAGDSILNDLAVPVWDLYGGHYELPEVY
jgi:hypothetical protein